MKVTNHYGRDYYAWQRKSGVLGGMIDLWQFEGFINPGDEVLDFGCGGGYLLANLNCRKKYGVDINEFARKEAIKNGITVYSDIDEIPGSKKFDVIISHHTLEHLTNPFEALKNLRGHLRRGGRSVHIVPIDDWRKEKTDDPNDINQHLFGWTPRLFGNLFRHAGYKVEKIDILTHAWLPLSLYLFPIIPKSIYHPLCMLWSWLTYNRQIRIVTVA